MQGNKLFKTIIKNIMTRFCFMGMLLSIGMVSFSYAQTNAPASFGPVPNENQMRWQEMEYYAFVHFSLNAYTDQSWGYAHQLWAHF